MMQLWIFTFAFACAAMLASISGALWALNDFRGFGLDADGVITLVIGSILASAIAVGLIAFVVEGDRFADGDINGDSEL